MHAYKSEKSNCHSREGLFPNPLQRTGIQGGGDKKRIPIRNEKNSNITTAKGSFGRIIFHDPAIAHKMHPQDDIYFLMIHRH
jgi:hypothetical protein